LSITKLLTITGVCTEVKHNVFYKNLVITS